MAHPSRTSTASVFSALCGSSVLGGRHDLLSLLRTAWKDPFHLPLHLRIRAAMPRRRSGLRECRSLRCGCSLPGTFFRTKSLAWNVRSRAPDRFVEVKVVIPKHPWKWWASPPPMEAPPWRLSSSPEHLRPEEAFSSSDVGSLVPASGQIEEQDST